MQKISLILIPVVIALVVCPLPGSREALAEMFTAEELIDILGYSEDDAKKLLAGEIVSHVLKSETDKELAVTVAMLAKVPLAEVVEFARSGEIYKANKSIHVFREIHDVQPDKNEFMDLRFEANEQEEVSKLLQVKAGSTFNLAASEIERFKSVANRFQSKGVDDPAVRKAISDEYQAILMDRYKAYREDGLEAVAAYDRGGKSSSPGQEIIDDVKRAKVIKEKKPNFYQAMLNYPRFIDDKAENQFFWFKSQVNKRPAFILAHRIYRFVPEEYAMSVFREYYVSHSYNALQIIVGALPVEKGTLVFYVNSTSTDQVAGFGGGMKRSIGSKMMEEKVIKLFTNYQQLIGQGGS